MKHVLLRRPDRLLFVALGVVTFGATLGYLELERHQSREGATADLVSTATSSPVARMRAALAQRRAAAAERAATNSVGATPWNGNADNAVPSAETRIDPKDLVVARSGALTYHVLDRGEIQTLATAARTGEKWQDRLSAISMLTRFAHGKDDDPDVVAALEEAAEDPNHLVADEAKTALRALR